MRFWCAEIPLAGGPLRAALFLGAALAFATGAIWASRHAEKPALQPVTANPPHSAVPPPVIVTADSYVCPMHSQVVSDHPGKCPICGMELVAHARAHEAEHLAGTPVSAGAAPGAGAEQFHVPPRTGQLLGLTFETVSRQELHPSLEVPGQIIADEQRAVNLSPKVDGWIRRLNVSVVGQPVQKGQVLFELYSPDLQQRQRDYIDILTRRDALLANAASMGTGLGNSTPDAMLASVARERYRIRSQLAAADVPDNVLDDLEKTRHVHDVVPVLAEHSGVVTSIGAREGAFVMPAQNVVSYADLSVVWVELSLEPDQLRGLHRGETVEVRSSIDPAVTVAARLDSSLAIVDPATRIAHVRVRLPPASRGFLPGTLVDARIEIPAHKALTVDADAVIYTGHGDFVIAPGAEPGTFEQIPVRVGVRSGSRVEVLGLLAGQRVVTNGHFLLSAEASLQHIRREALQAHD